MVCFIIMCFGVPLAITVIIYLNFRGDYKPNSEHFDLKTGRIRKSRRKEILFWGLFFYLWIGGISALVGYKTSPVHSSSSIVANDIITKSYHLDGRIESFHQKRWR